MRGNFPTHLARKTDSQRVQNLSSEEFTYLHKVPGKWEATEKIDGTSTTYIVDTDGELRVCGRNWELKPDAKATQMRGASILDLPNSVPAGTVIQGELFGPGIQDNRLKVSSVQFRVFSVSRINAGTVGVAIPFEEWPDNLKKFSVPRLDLELPDTTAEAIAQVNGLRSSITPSVLAEGVVWHLSTGVPVEILDYRSNFKVISNEYLAKGK